MLSSVLTDNGVACRACGAARAPRDEEAQFGACKTCWDSFQRHRDRKLPLADAFTEWLARRLVLDVRRHNRFGVSGRCEAVSDWLYGGHGTYQCGLPAIQVNEDGRKVCGIHAKASRPVYVEQDDRRYYDMITYLLTTIGLADAPFREAVLKATRLWPGRAA